MTRQRLPCPNCGMPVVSAKYCSVECRKATEIARNRERKEMMEKAVGYTYYTANEIQNNNMPLTFGQWLVSNQESEAVR